MPDYQLTVSDGTRIGFTDERDLQTIIDQVLEDGYLKITGERTLVDEAEQIEGDYVAFENNIVSIST